MVKIGHGYELLQRKMATDKAKDYSHKYTFFFVISLEAQIHMQTHGVHFVILASGP